MRGTVALLLFLFCCPMSAAGGEIPAIAYHDIVLKKGRDPFAITKDEFARQMAYLKRHDYRPISLQFLDKARRGEAKLPAKPVLLTFDDGLLSYYRHAYPILKEFGYPSVVGVVTAWTDGRATAPEYAAGLMTWEQLRELKRSALVDIVSHTDNLHHGVPANPQGGKLAAGVTRRYDPETGAYETERAFRDRIRADLKISVERIREELNEKPIGIVWPYGHYDRVLIDAATQLGMPYYLTMDAQPTALEDLPRINRFVFKRYRDLNDFADALSGRAYKKQQLRFTEIDLNAFTGKSIPEQEALLSALLNRLELLRVNCVIIAPLSSDLRRAFFHNDVLPIDVNILSRIGQQLLARTQVTHLFLYVPVQVPNVDAARLYGELSRLNWFTGVIARPPGSGAQWAEIAKVFRHYKPNIDLGVQSTLRPAVGTKDFLLVEIEVAATKSEVLGRAREFLSGSERTLFLLKRTAGTTDSQLVGAMRTLRAAGVRHYGYTRDDYLENSPVLLTVVGELKGHTIVANPR